MVNGAGKEFLVEHDNSYIILPLLVLFLLFSRIKSCKWASVCACVFGREREREREREKERKKERENASKFVRAYVCMNVCVCVKFCSHLTISKPVGLPESLLLFVI